MMKWMILLMLIGMSFSAYSNDDLAKVVKLRGHASAYEKNDKPFRLKLGTILSENTAVQTERGSFVRIKMSDGSLINLGPDSKVVVNRLPDSSRPGILSLVKGKLRAKVQKEDGQNKLFIRTKTASMGVRGTDFQVLYNPENSITNTVTYSGEVAMLQTSGLVSLPDLDRALSNDKVVSIKSGQFSFANPKISMRATEPTKISPAQFHSMRRNESFAKAARANAQKTKSKSITPKGISARGFVKEASVIKEMVSTKMIAVKEIKSPAPEGFRDTVTGKIAPPAGGYVDMKTGVYVAPPPGSVFDPVTGVYVPPVDYGGVDPKTGQYLPPAGATLNDKGELRKRNGDVVKIDSNPGLKPMRPEHKVHQDRRPPPPPPREDMFEEFNPSDLIPQTILPKGRVKFNFTAA